MKIRAMIIAAIVAIMCTAGPPAAVATANGSHSAIAMASQYIQDIGAENIVNADTVVSDLVTAQIQGDCAIAPSLAGNAAINLQSATGANAYMTKTPASATALGVATTSSVPQAPAALVSKAPKSARLPRTPQEVAWASYRSPAAAAQRPFPAYCKNVHAGKKPKHRSPTKDITQ